MKLFFAQVVSLKKLLVLVFCTNVFLLSAHESLVADTSRVYEIQEVEVQAHRIVTEIVPAQRMDAQLIEGLACQSVADAIRYFSGVQVKDFGGVGGIKTINIRSMGTNQMGVFYDGIQLGNAQNGQVDLGRFSLDNLESIDLYNGQKSVMLQAAKDYGSAGTIYLQTKRPIFKTGEHYHLIATVKTGSFGLVNPAFTWQQKVSPTVSSSLSAEYTYAHGRYRFRQRRVNPDGTLAYDTVAVRENADINALRTELAFNGTLNDGEWKAHVYNYYSERGLPGYVARHVYVHHQRQWDDNFFVQGSYRKNFSRWYSLLVNAKYAYDYTHYVNPDTTLQLVDNQYRQQEMYVSVANAFRPFKWWQIALSSDLQWNTLDADMVDFSYPTRYTALVAAASSIKFPNVKVQTSVLATYVHDQVLAQNAADDRFVLTPSLTAAVRPWREIPFDIRAFYKRIFRMPTFNDLYYTFIGNAQLKPEFVNQYDVGLSYDYQNSESVFQFMGLSVDGYYNQVQDKIVAVPGANPFRWQMLNLGRVRIVGLDARFSLGFTWLEHWQLQSTLTYTYQQAQDVTDPTESYYGDQIPYTPWHSGSVILSLSDKTWRLNYSFIYTGERYDQSANIPENYVQPWYTHDLSLSYQFDIKKTQFMVSAEVNNLFNQQYDVVLNYPMPGTNFKAIFKVTI